MSASILSHTFGTASVMRTTPLPLAIRSATHYHSSNKLALHLARRSFASTSATSVASTSQIRASLKDEDLKRASEGPHFNDSWKNTRPHEDWTSRHAVYTPEDVNSIEVVHHPTKTTTDKLARGMVKLARWGFDFVTGYKHASPEAARAALEKAGKSHLSVEQLQKEGYIMTKDQWMSRILFLESIAGVPGMVAAVIRHLRSLRLMKRDGGWIATLLQEAENERMHLLSFMKIGQPGVVFRMLVLGAQGVFWNAFFLAYIVSPSSAHRFVGYLEEEAVTTYTNIVNEIKLGHIPEWAPGKQEVPNIAKDYWRLGKDATMLDLILAVRADEASHRFTNHTLANLDKDDFNPLAMKHAPPEIEGRTDGFSREQSKDWLAQVQRELKPEETQAEKQELEK